MGKSEEGGACAVGLLEGLVGIRSLSGEEEVASAWLVEQMGLMGMRAWVDEVGNAVGEVGDSGASARELILLGHIDTVPGGVTVRREGDLLFGRGTVDAKGPLCAFVMAAAGATLPSGVRVVVVGAVEEEAASSKGARHIAATRRPDGCIIGEPSGWSGVTLGYKGRLICELRVERACHHSAGPGGSAADAAHQCWSNVLAWAQSATGGAARGFDQVQASLRSVHTVTDGLSETAEMTAGLRLPLSVLPEEAETAVREAAAELGEGVTVRCRGHERAFAVERSDDLARLFMSEIRQQGATAHPKLKTGTSDMNVVGPVWKCPIVAYGPGDSALDHTPNEHISIAEYEKSIGVLRGVIERWAAEAAASPRGA